MNFKKMMKRGQEGFTLVELIVVIAILGILGGIAVPAYSGYVEKANMGADQALIGEVMHALSLHHYANPNAGGGVVALSTSGASADDEFGAAAMKAAFGDDWETTAVLKYDGWDGVTTDQTFANAYTNSSYNGNEDSLITQLGDVTNLLKDALAGHPNLVGNKFDDFLKSNGIETTDNQAVSNAAILYAANTIGGMDAAKKDAVNSAFQAFYTGSSKGNVAILTASLRRELGTFGAVAAIYAQGEAFGQYAASNGNSDLLNDFHAIDVDAITDTDAALNQIAGNLVEMVQTAQTTASDIAMQYIGAGQYANDVTAYLEAMKKIDANADKFTDKLGSEGCYTDGSAASLLQTAVSAGSAGISTDGGIIVRINPDGSIPEIIGMQN